jgi:hypothetical protein
MLENPSWAILPLKDADMIRISPYYFYGMGVALNPLKSLKADAPMHTAIVTLYIASNTLERLFDGFYPFKACVNAGNRLYEVLQEVIDKYNTEKPDTLDASFSYRITSAANEFETILAAEMQTLDTYHASQKALYSTRDLIERAEIVLPETVRAEVPGETITEIQSAGKCLAFELPTACGFHIVRATEAVIREYYRAVVGTVPKVKARNWGSYIRFLKEKGADAKIITVLEQVKDTYRNPIVHPEDVLEMEDAIILFGMAQGVIISMMKDIAIRKAAAGKKALAAVPATGT